MTDLDELTGLSDARGRIDNLAGLIGNKFKNQRLLTKTELLEKLKPAERELVEWYYTVEPTQFGLKLPFYGIEEATNPDDFIKLRRYLPSLIGKRVLDIQYVPKPAYRAFTDLKNSLTSDTTGQIKLGSAYRSPAFQTLLLSYWVVTNGFDMKRTLTNVALPGYTEHGLIKHGAIDFQLGREIYLPSDRAKLVSQTIEYKWLESNASKFGFILSYPPNNPYRVAFEPWHWRYIG